MPRKRNFLSFSLVLASLVLAIMVSPIFFTDWGLMRVAAQDTEEDPWTEPVNISNSGSTTNPVIVVDNLNDIHVVWSDEFAGSVYARLSDGEWTPPIAIEFPFDEYMPVLLSAGDSIHAFWINTEKDNSLTYSRILASEFGISNSWSSPSVISKFIGDFDVEYAQFEETGHFNLAYIFTGEDANRSSGIYYVRSGEGGSSWSEPVSLYTSRYYRPVDPKSGNVDISTALENSSETIFTAWDNRAVKRIYLAKSTDQGATWSSPLEVDGPTAETSSNGPFNLLVQASGSDDVLLVWQSNLQSGFNCTQYYQSSPDGGKTWSDRGTMLDGFVGCAEENKFIPQPEGVLSQIIFQDQVYLIAWDGTRWSEPEAQSTLYSFTDPNTDEAVRYRCRQSTLDMSNQLFFAGCDEIGSTDIWVTSRKLGEISSWFPPSSIWNEPQLVGEGETVIQYLEALMDPLGRFHILWVSTDSEQTSTKQGSLYYTVWNNEEIAIPTKILASPDRDFGQFSAGLDSSRNRLILTWNDRKTGEIFFSWADIAKAGSVFEWAAPISVPIAATLSQAPAIQAGLDGKIYITYAVPINEGRGIYLVYSEDSGVSWSDSIKVFDADEANWEIVENPRIAQNEDGALHVIWNQNRYADQTGLPGGYYNRSLDHGFEWGQAQMFFENIPEPGWLAAVGEQDVFRFWITPNGEQSSLLNELSRDSGESWMPAENLTGLGETPLLLDLTVGPPGVLNLVQVIQKKDGAYILRPQVWRDGSWTGIENQELQEDSIQNVTALSSGVTPDGELAAVYALTQIDQPDLKESYRLFFISQKSTDQQASQTAEVSVTAVSTETLATGTPLELSATVASTPLAPTATSLLASITTPTRVVTPVPNLEPPESTIDPIMGLILGGVLSMIVVAVVVVFARSKRVP